MSKFDGIRDMLSRSGDSASALLLSLVGTETENPQWLRRLSSVSAGDVTSTTVSTLRSVASTLQVHGSLLQRLTQQVLQSVTGSTGRHRTSQPTVRRTPTMREVMLYGKEKAQKRIDDAAEARERRQKWSEKLKERVREATKESPTVQRLSKMLGAFGRVGAAAGAAIAIAYGLFKMAKSFPLRQLESNREMSQFGGKAAGAYARLRFADIQRSYTKASILGGDAEQLTSAVSDMRDALLPMSIVATRGFTKLATGIANVVEVIALIPEYLPDIAGLREIKEYMRDVRKDIKEARDEAKNAIKGNDFHDALMRQDFQNRKQRAPLPPVQ